jgi:hypothetical protein
VPAEEAQTTRALNPARRPPRRGPPAGRASRLRARAPPAAAAPRPRAAPATARRARPRGSVADDPGDDAAH